MKYFKKVLSYENLKEQYKNLLKAHHPDNGGDVAVMQEINAEYDALFAIWKDRKEVESGEKVQETANSTRNQFYTDFGWEGSNHDWNLSLKEIAKIVRNYVKMKYPTYKFSVRTSYASMCQELHVDLKESPIPIYKEWEEMTDDDKKEVRNKLEYNHLWPLTTWTECEEKEVFERSWEKRGNFFRCLNEVTRSVIKDVDSFVKSYNYEDCDGRIDYFDVDFYYLGCCQNNGQNVKIVPKTPRIKTKSKTTSKSKKENQKKELELVAGLESRIGTTGYTYNITQDEDTRDGSVLWVVRIEEKLDKSAYIAENKRLKELGGYYSKYKHGFIFRVDPTEKLTA